MIKEINIGDKVYYSEMWIFRVAALILLVFAVYIVFLYPNEGFYVECKGPGPCANMLYNNSNYCGTKILSDSALCTTPLLLPNTSLGDPPPVYIANGTYFAIAIFLLAFIINTLIYNRGFFKQSSNKPIGQIK